MNMRLRLAFIFVIAAATIATAGIADPVSAECLANDVQAAASRAVQPSQQPLTANQIAAAIGSDADARTVMSMFLTDAFRPAGSPRTEYVLRNQMRDEWLPTVEGVEIVQLSDADAAARWATCRSYMVISVSRQSNGSVRVIRSAKCSASARGTNFAIRDGQWREVGRGIGSGFAGIPADCVPCIKP